MRFVITGETISARIQWKKATPGSHTSIQKLGYLCTYFSFPRRHTRFDLCVIRTVLYCTAASKHSSVHRDLRFRACRSVSDAIGSISLWQLRTAGCSPCLPSHVNHCRILYRLLSVCRPRFSTLSHLPSCPKPNGRFESDPHVSIAAILCCCFARYQHTAGLTFWKCCADVVGLVSSLF